VGMHSAQKVEMSTMMLYGVHVRMKARRMALRVCAAFFSFTSTILFLLVIWFFRTGSRGLEVEEAEGEAVLGGCSASGRQGDAVLGLPFLGLEPGLNL